MQFQILENKDLKDKFKVETIKIGVPIKKKEPEVEEQKKEEKNGDIELSSDGLLIQDDEANGEFAKAKKPRRRKVEEAKTDESSPKKRQKI